jgi:hydroxylamine reductase
MFCFQCQETVGNRACTRVGVCGKQESTANLQDLSIYLLRGLSIYQNELAKVKKMDHEANELMLSVLFSTITNANFDDSRFNEYISRAISIRKRLSATVKVEGALPDEAVWSSSDPKEIARKASTVGFLSIKDEDERSLVAIITYGLKGMAAYYHHASVLGGKDDAILVFMNEALAKTIPGRAKEGELLQIALRTGEYGVRVMALLDGANTKKYGIPSPGKVRIGVRDKPGILISGHDLKDLEELLEQTTGTGVDVYTHGEMLPAHHYPFFKKYENLYGNYGGSWWHQGDEFDKFNGPILLTSNCLIPPKASYKDRTFTTSIVGFQGMKHIPDRRPGKMKDFSGMIEQAKRSKPPTKLEDGEIPGGFSHAYLDSVLDLIIQKVKEGKISRFYVMAGCDGRLKSRDYYTEFAKNLPHDSIILTAGCAKFRYNKLPLGDIDGIPRVIDAGQCNDSYSLALTAIALSKKLGADLNSLPISYNIAWYEQKAALVLLALLHLGVRNIHLGPSLPAFVSENNLLVLISAFALKGITGNVSQDIEAMQKGN